MAPFTQNMDEVHLVSSTIQDDLDSLTTFEARIDGDWLVGVVPNGGYLLGLILQACNLIQQTSQLQDPLYLSSQFIGVSSIGQCTIVVQRLKKGKNYTNLAASLLQNGKANIHCQLIYGILPVAKHPFGPFPASPSNLTHAHPSRLSRRCPLSTHPSKCKHMPFTRPFTFTNHLAQSVDAFYAEEMDKLAVGQAAQHQGDLGGGEFIWAGWVEILGSEDTITVPMLPFLADLTPDVIPRVLDPERAPMWFPTLALTVDFKYRVPSTSEIPAGIAPRTVGLFVTNRFLIEGRHAHVVEIWTAPSGIGEGVEDEGWRERMFCLASAAQTALSVPGAVNVAKGKRREGSKL